MPKCPFAKWREISGSSGTMLSGPYKIVHHTTEGSNAAGAMATYKAKGCDPHFTVDRTTIFQHIDTDEGARALRNHDGGPQTNRDSAVQIELVGFAHQPKHPDSLVLLARLCRWIEQTHGVPQVWPSGQPKPAKNGKDPGGHNRDPNIWDSQSGHYGHCHVPENDHWDPGYSATEVAFLMQARFDEQGNLVSARPQQPPVGGGGRVRSTMPDHGDVDAARTIAIPVENAPVIRTRSGRVLNARADTLDFRDRMYEATLIEVPLSVDLAEYLKCDVPVLDQLTDGACTGFALATVAHYLLRKRVRYPDTCPVSARMFYELARRYDEWPGEDYEGSSARGAIKGWHKHGVCAEIDWGTISHLDQNDPGFNDARIQAALRRPLGSYFRVNHKDLIAMHVAIAEVGILYATAMAHTGWEEVDASGQIPFSPDTLGGHAFAIVAYDENGFWIQNSWGRDWGKGGLGHISYDDWLANGTDVWVARLGAPVKLQHASAQATAHSALAGQSVAYSYADLRPHLISIGNDGRLQAGGDYGTSAREVATIFTQDIPAAFKSTEKKRLLLYAHGALVSEQAAAQRVAEYRAALAGTGVYPLAFIWRTDYWTTITNMLQDAVRRRRTEGTLDKSKDFLLDRLDDALEPLVRELTGKAAWDEIKENAHLAAAPGGALPVVIRHIMELKRTYPDLEIHLVGHSAGSILLASLVKLLTSDDNVASGLPQGRKGERMRVATCTLWAPACSIELFKDSYLPAIDASVIEKFTLYCLDDKTEQSDHCARIYNKSLLYLVSNALERTRRVPGRPFGLPLLGLERALRADSTIAGMIGAGRQIELVVAPNTEPESSLQASRASAHGAFDDDKLTVSSTFRRIVAAPNMAAPIQLSPLVFAKSAKKLMAIRKDIDMQSRPPQP